MKKRRRVPEEKWAQEKIKKAEKVLTRIKGHEPFFSQIVFWSSILVIVIGNLLMSIAMIPVLAVLNRWFLDMVILLVALVMGFIFNFLITNIGHLDRHHHILAAIIVPIIAVGNVIFIVLIGNQLMEAVEIANVRHNPWIIGILYGAVFIFPYLYYRLRKVYK